MPFLLEDVDEDSLVTVTWSRDADGTLRHNPTGMCVTTDRGVEVGGREYRLNPREIEFDRDDRLGAGSGGVVQAGVHKPSGVRVAVKTVKVDGKENRQRMLSEIQGLIQAQGCPYLVQWYAGFVGKDTGVVHIVVELMDLGSLADLRRRVGGSEQRVPEAHLACIAAQMARALEHLHARRLLHRDVKPENVLHDSTGRVKLTDFGISKDLNSTVGVADSFVGTATYMAPERALGKDYSFKSDVWSVGMVLYEFATGSYPFNHKAFLDLYECLCVQPEPRLDAADFTPAFCDFVARCLTRDDLRRSDAATMAHHELIARSGDAERAAFASWLAKLRSPGIGGHSRCPSGASGGAAPALSGNGGYAAGGPNLTVPAVRKSSTSRSI